MARQKLHTSITGGILGVLPGMLQGVLALYETGMDGIENSPVTNRLGSDLRVSDVVVDQGYDYQVFEQSPDPGLGMIIPSAALATHAAELTLKYVFQVLEDKPAPVQNNGHDLARYFGLLAPQVSKQIEKTYSDSFNRYEYV